MRTNIAGTSPWEPLIGFSRAVRCGDQVHVSGTGPVGADTADAATQTRQVLDIIAGALAQAGLTLEHVFRTRIYLTDVADAEPVGRVHAQYFSHIRPAATMVVVARLLHPFWRVEIEAEASLHTQGS